jgi:hypothetical protein
MATRVGSGSTTKRRKATKKTDVYYRITLVGKIKANEMIDYATGFEEEEQGLKPWTEDRINEAIEAEADEHSVDVSNYIAILASNYAENSECDMVISLTPFEQQDVI